MGNIIHDQWYTSDKAAAFTASVAHTTLLTKFLEPSAGGGAVVRHLVGDIKAIDIDPKDDSVEQGDFLSLTDDLTGVCVVGNPPYGKRNELSTAFINHAFKLGAEAVVFILPNAFVKEQIRRRLKGSVLSAIFELPSQEYTTADGLISVPTKLFVFSRNGVSNPPVWDMTSPDFEIAKKEGADFFIMGAAPHNTKNLDEVKETNRGYYIKALTTGVRERMSNMVWPGLSSASGGVAWRTPQEIYTYYNQENNV